MISTLAKWVPMASIFRNRGVVESTAFSIVSSLNFALPAPAPPVALPMVVDVLGAEAEGLDLDRLRELPVDALALDRRSAGVAETSTFMK